MKEPILVAQVIGKWVGGGVEAVIMNYYKNMDKSKIQFDFICDEDSTSIPYDEIEKMGGRVILIPPYQKVFKYQKELIRIFSENKYKIVHSNINTLSFFSLRAAKKAGVPIRIAHSHSTTNKKELKKNILKQLLRPLSKIYATDYFACSKYAGKWLFGKKMVRDNKVTIVNNAIDVETFKYNNELRRTKRKELGIDDDTIIVGHIGRFVRQKNHDFLIDIFKEIHNIRPNSRLLLIGKGPEEKEIKRKVNGLNLEKEVEFLGQRDDVSELYQAFDVFLLPSLYEGLPVVGIEAQASGVLCVFSSKITEEVKNVDSTIFMSLDKKAIDWADNILKEYDQFERKDVSKEIANNGFDIREEYKKLTKKYEELVEKI